MEPALKTLLADKHKIHNDIVANMLMDLSWQTSIHMCIYISMLLTSHLPAHVCVDPNINDNHTYVTVTTNSAPAPPMRRGWARLCLVLRRRPSPAASPPTELDEAAVPEVATLAQPTRRHDVSIDR